MNQGWRVVGAKAPHRKDGGEGMCAPSIQVIASQPQNTKKVRINTESYFVHVIVGVICCK